MSHKLIPHLSEIMRRLLHLNFDYITLSIHPSWISHGIVISCTRGNNPCFTYSYSVNVNNIPYRNMNTFDREAFGRRSFSEKRKASNGKNKEVVAKVKALREEMKQEAAGSQANAGMWNCAVNPSIVWGAAEF